MTKCEGAELGEIVRSECRQLALSNASLLCALRAPVPVANSIHPLGWGILSFNESNSVLRDDRNPSDHYCCGVRATGRLSLVSLAL